MIFYTPRMKEFILQEKKQLTHDVYELKYVSDTDMSHVPWQFVTFILPDGIGGRSYSVLSADKNEFVLIIKRVADGKKGSITLCDAEVGTSYKWVGPVGKFVLSEEKNAKLFAGTGTGVVPLYNQILTSLESGNTKDICLLFWVRKETDLFYQEQFNSLSEKYNNFEVKYALSRESIEGYHHGYITDFVDTDLSQRFDEAYLCWAPVVVDSMEEVLKKYDFDQEKIYTEKY